MGQVIREPADEESSQFTETGKSERASETMDTTFSIDDFSDSFWDVPPLSPSSLKAVTAAGLSRSESEWKFEMLLEDMSSSVSASSANGNAIGVSSALSFPSVSGTEDIEHNGRVQNPDSENRNRSLPSDPLAANVVDSDECYRVLKSKLDSECAAAVALRATYVKPEDSSSSLKQIKPAQSGSQKQGSLVAHGVSSAVPSKQKKTGLEMKQATSGSSREDSDEDEFEGDIVTTGLLQPDVVKRTRRMLSNRESARRSRRKKQEQMNELETQVNQLKVEHSSLVNQLDAVNHKYDEAAVGNRILKADIETLRAKVKLAEETVKRVTGMNLFHGRPNGQNGGIFPMLGNPIGTPLSNLERLSNVQIPKNTLPTNFSRCSTTAATMVPPLSNSQTTCAANTMGGGQEQVGVGDDHAASGTHRFRPVRGWGHGLAPRAVPENNHNSS